MWSGVELKKRCCGWCCDCSCGLCCKKCCSVIVGCGSGVEMLWQKVKVIKSGTIKIFLIFESIVKLEISKKLFFKVKLI